MAAQLLFPDHKTDDLRHYLIILGFLLYVLPGLAQEGKGDPGMFLLACEEGRIESAIRQLDLGVDINSTTDFGATGLILAAQNGHLSTVRSLVINGAKIDLQDSDGITALIAATHFEHFEVAEYLITAGAKLNLKDNRGLNALFYAAAYGDTPMLEMFLFYGASPSTKDSEGRDPWLAAVWGGHLSAVSLLKRSGYNIHSKDIEGNNALFYAVSNHDKVMADSLLTWGVDTFLVNKRGINLLDLAFQEKQNDFILLFKSFGIKKTRHPILDKVYGELSMISNTDDTHGAIRLQASDSRRDWWYRISFTQRLNGVPVIYRMNDQIEYQFHESFSAYSMGIGKDFLLYQPGQETKICLRNFIDTGILFRSYRGSEIKPPVSLLLSIETGLVYIEQNWNIFAGYQYFQSNKTIVSPHRLVASIGLKLW